jgi:uncharacterized protein YacL
VLRGAIGFILGMCCNFFVVASFVESSATCDYTDFIITCIVTLVVFVTFMFWCHKHHLKMRNKYYNRFKKTGW